MTESRIKFIGNYNHYTVEEMLENASNETGKDFEMNIHTGGHYTIQCWWDDYKEMENVTITLEKSQYNTPKRKRDEIRAKNEDKIRRAIELIK